MIDVFIRTLSDQNRVREDMYNLTCSRWDADPMANWMVFHLNKMSVTAFRTAAESQSKSDPYIITDDDVLIMGQNWIQRAVDIVLSHPEYAIVSTLSVVEGENCAKGEGDIYDMHAVGQPMIIRKGYCTNLPEMSLDQECGILHKHVLDQGKKMGLIGKRDIRHNHLGHGFSSNPILRWAY